MSLPYSLGERHCFARIRFDVYIPILHVQIFRCITFQRTGHRLFRWTETESARGRRIVCVLNGSFQYLLFQDVGTFFCNPGRSRCPVTAATHRSKRLFVVKIDIDIFVIKTKLFGNAGKQPLVFETKEGFPNSDMGEAAFRRLKDQLREAARRASGTGEAILLEAGLTAKPIEISTIGGLPCHRATSSSILSTPLPQPAAEHATTSANRLR